MSKLKQIAYPTENGGFIYVPKRVVDLVSKKAIITKMYAVAGSGEKTEIIFITKEPKVKAEFVEDDYRGKLVIEYESIKCHSHGIMELYDMGSN